MNCGNSMVETIKLLGCFSPATELPRMLAGQRPKLEFQVKFAIILYANSSNYHSSIYLQTLIQQIFLSDSRDYARLKSKPEFSPQNFPAKLFSCTVLLRMIYDMAVDNYVKNSKIVLESSDDGDASVSEEGKESKKQLKTLNLTPIPPDPVVVHAGMVTTLLKILPSLYFEEWPDMSLSLQLFCAETIKSLLR